MHYAWVPVQYTPSPGGHTHPTRTHTCSAVAGSNTVLPVSCPYSIQSHTSTRRSESECPSIPKQLPCSERDYDHENVYELQRIKRHQPNLGFLLLTNLGSPRHLKPKTFSGRYHKYKKSNQFRNNQPPQEDIPSDLTSSQ